MRYQISLRGGVLLKTSVKELLIRDSFQGLPCDAPKSILDKKGELLSDPLWVWASRDRIIELPEQLLGEIMWHNRYKSKGAHNKLIDVIMETTAFKRAVWNKGQYGTAGNKHEKISGAKIDQFKITA